MSNPHYIKNLIEAVTQAIPPLTRVTTPDLIAVLRKFSGGQEPEVQFRALRALFGIALAQAKLALEQDGEVPDDILFISDHLAQIGIGLHPRPRKPNRTVRRALAISLREN